MNNFTQDCYAEFPNYEGYCPTTVQYVLKMPICWPSTKAGHTRQVPCPNIQTFLVDEMAERICMPNGTWYRPMGKEHWSNFTKCFNREHLDYQQLLNNLWVVGYSISLVALIIALIIFLTFRSLRCTRIRIHIQLFLSFILNYITYIIWYKVIIPSYYYNPHGFMWCQVFLILMPYTMVANYMWMFCESLYLIISLIVVFVRNKVIWPWFLIIGWGLPFTTILIYVLARFYIYDDFDSCWDASPANNIYEYPVFGTLFISFLFLLYVLFIIVRIMRPKNDNPTPTRVKKAVRAALILIPLFGLQFIIIPIRPQNEEYEKIYDYVSICVTTMQGLCVAVLFCFINKDVHQVFKNYMNRRSNIAGWQQPNITLMDSAGVYMINSSNNTNSIKMLLKRKSTCTSVVRHDEHTEHIDGSQISQHVL